MGANILSLFSITNIIPTFMEKVERFNMAFEYLKSRGILHSQKDVALVMKSSETNISRAFNGNPKYLTDNFLRRFCKIFGTFINESWLIDEEGLMLKSTIHELADPDMFKPLSEKDRSIILGIIGRIRQLGHYSDEVKNLGLVEKLIDIVKNNKTCNGYWIFTGDGVPKNQASEDDFYQLEEKFKVLLDDYKEMKEERDFWREKSQDLEYKMSKLKAV